MLEETPGQIQLALEPLDDYVVIEPSDEESETRGGLIIPASAETACATGIVTAVGPDAESVEPGDKVLFPKGAASMSVSPARRSRSSAASS